MHHGRFVKQRRDTSEAFDHNQPLQNKVSQKRLKKTRNAHCCCQLVSDTVSPPACNYVARQDLLFAACNRRDGEAIYSREAIQASSVISTEKDTIVVIKLQMCTCGLHIVEVGWFWNVLPVARWVFLPVWESETSLVRQLAASFLWTSPMHTLSPSSRLAYNLLSTDLYGLW